MTRLLATLIGLLSLEVAQAQKVDSLLTAPDSARAFTIEEFYDMIVKNHPVARQAGLLSEVARQEIRMARGNFDPKLGAEFSSKTFNGKSYYEIFNTSLKFPMRVPIDPVIGLDRNTGANLDPEHFIDDQFNYRQVYAGVSVPLGRGLFTDERRTALRQAELFKTMTEAEQLKMINKLLLDAAKDYWDWYYAYYNFRLLNRSVQIAGEIFRRVKVNFTYGEASVVDTVQAKITWQQRAIEQQEAFVNLKNTTVELSNMLWDDAGNGVNVDIQWVPVLNSDPWALTTEGLKELAEQAKVNHPELRKIETKIYQLEADKRLAAEYLKPQLNVNYYALNQPINPAGAFSLELDRSYKLGVDFSFPLFLRKERSKLALTKLKISNTQLELSATERQIINNLTVVYNQLSNLQGIMANQKEMVESYERLLEAELLNLEQGESDLFKINVQQEKLIQAQTKWLKLLAENEKQKAQLYWAAGTSRMAQ